MDYKCIHTVLPYSLMRRQKYQVVMRPMEYLSIVRSCGVDSLQILLYCFLSMGFYNAGFKMAQDYRVTQKIIRLAGTPGHLHAMK